MGEILPLVDSNDRHLSSLIQECLILQTSQGKVISVILIVVAFKPTPCVEYYLEYQEYKSNRGPILLHPYSPLDSVFSHYSYLSIIST